MNLRRLIRRVEPADAADGASLGTPLLDPMGEAFTLLRSSGAEVGIWRAELFEVSSLDDDHPLLVAVYDAHDLEHVVHVLTRHPTIVIGIGIGEWLGSRALSLGALGYVHDGLDAGAVRGRLADAFARHRHRRARAQSVLASAPA